MPTTENQPAAQAPRARPCPNCADALTTPPRETCGWEPGLVPVAAVVFTPSPVLGLVGALRSQAARGSPRQNRARRCHAPPGPSAAAPATGTRRSNSASRWSRSAGFRGRCVPARARNAPRCHRPGPEVTELVQPGSARKIATPPASHCARTMHPRRRPSRHRPPAPPRSRRATEYSFGRTVARRAGPPRARPNGGRRPLPARVFTSNAG